MFEYKQTSNGFVAQATWATESCCLRLFTELSIGSHRRGVFYMERILHDGPVSGTGTAGRTGGLSEMDLEKPGRAVDQHLFFGLKCSGSMLFSVLCHLHIAQGI